jgi:hypothetical protein
MKAHKYLKPRLVISAVYAPPEYDGNPWFFTVTSPDVREIHDGFPDKINKK